MSQHLDSYTLADMVSRATGLRGSGMPSESPQPALS